MNRMIIMNAAKAPTNDLNLWKVIMHSVNKADIIDRELYGIAAPVDALFPKTCRTATWISRRAGTTTGRRQLVSSKSHPFG